MKFEINAKDFKGAVERCSIISKEYKNEDSFFHYLCINADKENNIITFKVRSVISFIELNVKANVEEGGCIVATIENIKNFLNIPGVLRFELVDNNMIVTNGKKKGQIKVVNEIGVKDIFEDFPSGNGEFLVSTDSNELNKTFSDLEPALNVKEGREIMTGFHLDIKEKFICSCDGYKIIKKDISNWNFSNDIGINNVNIRHDVIKEFKSVSNKNEIVSIHFGKFNKRKYFLTFSGSDFRYFVSVLEGDYLNVFSYFKEKAVRKFTINNADMLNTVKEYSKILKIKEKGEINKKPMVIICKEKELYTVAMGVSYKTYDKFDMEKATAYKDDILVCFNPCYLNDILKISAEDETRFEFLSPWNTFSGSYNTLRIINGNYTSIILPVRSDKSIQEATKFIKG